MHEPQQRLEDALSRMDRYSTAGAEQMLAAGKRRDIHVRDRAWAMDVHPAVSAAGRLPRRPRGLPAGRRQRRRHLLSLHESLKLKWVPTMSGLISIVVTTFDREADALDAKCCASLSRQDDRGFEVVVADDGSGPDTAALIEQWKPRLGVPLSHVRHEASGISRRRAKSATARCSPHAATTSCSSTAIAWRGRISSPPIAGSRSPAGSSPAIARCWTTRH